MPENEQQIYALLQLASIPLIGSQRIRNLVARFKTPQNALAASAREIMEIQGIDKNLARQIKCNVDTKFADEQMAIFQKSGAKILVFWDKDYPDNLKKIHDP